jgi:hypothetical protein
LIEDFVAKKVNVTRDHIVLHVNVSKMLLDEESHDVQLLRQMLSVHKVSFEKTVGILLEHHFMYLDSLYYLDVKKPVKLVIYCCFASTRWEQLQYLHP